MRISDWSSDVCSSDLATLHRDGSDLGTGRQHLWNGPAHVFVEHMKCRQALVAGTDGVASIGLHAVQKRLHGGIIKVLQYQFADAEPVCARHKDQEQAQAIPIAAD